MTPGILPNVRLGFVACFLTVTRDSCQVTNGSYYLVEGCTTKFCGEFRFEEGKLAPSGKEAVCGAFLVCRLLLMTCHLSHLLVSVSSDLVI